MTPAERAALRAAMWASAGVAAAAPLLIVPPPGADPGLPAIVHLAVLGAFAAGLAFHLAPVAGEPWLAGTSLGEAAGRGAAGMLVVAMIAGSVAVVAVATAAALRFDPSLQYHQVLAALHMATVASAVVIGARRRFGALPAAAGAAAVVAAGVWTAWRYFDAVGFSPSGGWVVDGSRMRSLALPYLLGSAVAAAAVFAAGIGGRRSGPESGGPVLPTDPGAGTF